MLVTWNVYVTTSPTAATVVGLADFTIVSAGVCVTGTVADDGGDTGGVTPNGGVAGRSRSVGDRPGIDVGLGDGVGRRAV